VLYHTLIHISSSPGTPAFTQLLQTRTTLPLSTFIKMHGPSTAATATSAAAPAASTRSRTHRAQQGGSAANNTGAADTIDIDTLANGGVSSIPGGADPIPLPQDKGKQKQGAQAAPTSTQPPANRSTPTARPAATADAAPSAPAPQTAVVAGPSAQTAPSFASATTADVGRMAQYIALLQAQNRQLMASATSASATPAVPAPAASALSAPTPVSTASVPVPSFDDNPVAAALQPFLVALGGAFSQAPVVPALDQVIPGFKASASDAGELLYFLAPHNRVCHRHT
jgi:hypothetical protein